MKFKKYQHVEKINREECTGLLEGQVFVQPKIDGTNSCVWLENGIVHAGSRNRELTLDNDNADFYNTIIKDENIKQYLLDHPNYILYGEWLVKHTIKYYNEDAWKKFYVFDVVEYRNDNDYSYVNYYDYSVELRKYHINYIPCLAVLFNPSIDDLARYLKENHYLIDDENKIGEGIVCKNYTFVNKYGHTVWGKIVAEEFFGTKQKLRQKNHEEKTESFESRIAYEYITDAVIQKEYAKLKLGFPDLNRGQLISSLLNAVYNAFLMEDLVTVVKTNKNCKIDFLVMKKASDNRCKTVLKDELF